MLRLQCVLPKILHKRPRVVIFCSSLPWGCVSQTLRTMSLKVREEITLLFPRCMKISSTPFRNVTVRSLNIKWLSWVPPTVWDQFFDEDIDVILQDYWNIGPQWLLFDRDNKRLPGFWPTIQGICTNGFSMTTACWGPRVHCIAWESPEYSPSLVPFERCWGIFRGLSKQSIAFALKINHYSEANENTEGLVFVVLKSKKS